MQNRTADLLLTMETLYRLSYRGKRIKDTRQKPISPNAGISLLVRAAFGRQDEGRPTKIHELSKQEGLGTRAQPFEMISGG